MTNFQKINTLGLGLLIGAGLAQSAFVVYQAINMGIASAISQVILAIL